MAEDRTRIADARPTRAPTTPRESRRRLQVRVILRRNHVGLSLWRHGRLVAAICCLVYPTSANRPALYPAFHIAVDWRTRMWSYFGGPAANGAVPRLHE
jgi:hypothetical protein